MKNEQKLVLIAYLVLFFLIPIYGLSHSLSTYNTATRLTPALVILLEILLILLVYILFNIFGEKPFHHLKKIIPIFITVLISGMIGLVFLFFISNSFYHPESTEVATPTADPSFIPLEYIVITNNSGEALGKDRSGNDIYRLVVQNNSDVVAKDVMIKFEFMKSSDGPVQDTKYVTLSQSIVPSDTITENVAIYTSFDTVNRYWWRATVVGAKNSSL